MSIRFQIRRPCVATIAASAICSIGLAPIALAQQPPSGGFQQVLPLPNQQFGPTLVSAPEAAYSLSYLQVTPAIRTQDGRTAILYGLGDSAAISLDQFATSNQVQQLQSQVDQIPSIAQIQQARARIEQLAFFARRDFQRLNEGIALSSALTIMPPNPGDRFAVTVGGAGFNGRGAGAITGTYRVNESVMVFGGYARSETQNLVKGGATFSFR